MKKSIFNWVLLSILLFFLITIFFLYDQKEKKFLYSKEIIKCTDLNYEETQMNSKNKFGSFDLELKILNERKWKKTLINNQIDNLENKSFTYFMANRYDEHQIKEYAPFDKYFLKDIKRNLSKKYNYFGDKYNAINMGHNKTIELRFFGGCNKIDEFYSKIEYLQSLFEFVKTAPINTDVINYAGFVNLNKKRFENLHKTINTGAGRNAIKNATHSPINEEY